MNTKQRIADLEQSRICFDCGDYCEKVDDKYNCPGCDATWAADAWVYWVVSNNSKGVNFDGL